MNSYYFEKHWRQVEDGECKSLRDSLCIHLAEKSGGTKSLGLTSDMAVNLQDYYINVFFNGMNDLLKKIIQKDREMDIELENHKDQEQQLHKLGVEFLRSARVHTSDYDFFKSYVDAGLDVNFQDPKSKMTALHIVAGQNGRQHVDKLIESKRCDYLILDQKFRLPHELATKFSDVSDVCSRLYALEEAQMIAGGFKDFDEYALSENGHWRLRHLSR